MTGKATLLQVVASARFQLVLGDIRGAFLEADAESRPNGPVFACPPKNHTPKGHHPEQLYELVNGYGGVDQPQRWYSTFKRYAEEIGFVAHPLDPCLFMLFEPVRSNKEVPSMPICIPEGSRCGAPGALCGIFDILVGDAVGGGRGARWEDAMSKY